MRKQCQRQIERGLQSRPIDFPSLWRRSNTFSRVIRNVWTFVFFFGSPLPGEVCLFLIDAKWEMRLYPELNMDICFLMYNLELVLHIRLS